MAGAFARTHSTPPTTTSEHDWPAPPPDAPRRPAPPQMHPPPPEPAALPARPGLNRGQPARIRPRGIRHRGRRRSLPSAAGNSDVTDPNDDAAACNSSANPSQAPPPPIVAVTPHPDTSVANWSPEATTRNRPSRPPHTIDKPGRLEPNYTTRRDWDFYRNCAACTGRRPFPASLGVSCRLPWSATCEFAFVQSPVGSCQN